MRHVSAWALVLLLGCGSSGRKQPTGDGGAGTDVDGSTNPMPDRPGSDSATDRSSSSDVAGDRNTASDGTTATDMGRADGSTMNPIPANPVVEEVRAGFTFVEGPVWFASTGELFFTDIPQNTIWRHTPPSTFEVFRMPSANTNGLAIAPDGALIACEHSGRRVSRSMGTAAPTLVVDRWPGGGGTTAGRLNSPNDAIVRRDGTIYFTDPDYGVSMAMRELTFTGVFRVDPAGQIFLVSRDLARPNGIALSPDERILYVTNTTPAQLRAFPVNADGSTGAGTVFTPLARPADGIAVDDAGNIYATTSMGVEVIRPDGQAWGTIRLPRGGATNCTFGDPDRRTLYVMANGNGMGWVYRVRLNIPGKP